MNKYPRVFRLFSASIFFGALVSGCMPVDDEDRQQDADGLTSIDVAEGETSDAFFAVIDHLDVGGVFFTYVDLEDDIADFARNIGPFLAELQEMASPFPAFPLDVEGIVNRAHLDGMRAFGLSSIRSEGLFRNSGFLYLPDGRQGIFRVAGGEPRTFEGLAHAPADTSVYYETEYDIPALTEVVIELAETVMGDAGRNMIESWKQQPVDESGITPGDIIEALDGRLSVVLRLNTENRLPVPGAGATFAEPELLVRAVGRGLGTLLEKALEDAPTLVRSDEDGVTVFEAADALPGPFAGRRPVFMIEADVVLFSLSRSFLDESRNLNGDTLGTQEDFERVMASLGGPDGNGMFFARPVVFQEIRDLIEESGGVHPEAAMAVAIIAGMVPDIDRPIATLRRNMDQGILFRSQWPGSHKQTMISGGYFNPVVLGLLSSMAIPAYTRVRENSVEARTDNDARQLASAAQQYFLEENVREVSIGYDPATGEISGPLSMYLGRIAEGYDRFPEVLTLDGEFVLGHPLLPEDRRYNDFGQFVGPSWE